MVKAKRILIISLCLLFLCSITSAPVHAGPCEAGLAKCTAAAVFSWGIGGGMGMGYCIIGYSVCIAYY